jgi:hypothetical protein
MAVRGLWSGPLVHDAESIGLLCKAAQPSGLTERDLQLSNTPPVPPAGWSLSHPYRRSTGCESLYARGDKPMPATATQVLASVHFLNPGARPLAGSPFTDSHPRSASCTRARRRPPPPETTFPPDRCSVVRWAQVRCMCRSARSGTSRRGSTSSSSSAGAPGSGCSSLPPPSPH